MKTSPTIGAIAAALAKAQGEFKVVGYDSDNPHFKSKFASLAALVTATRPALTKNGIAVLQGALVPETNEGVLVGFAVETLLAHTSGEWISVPVVVPVEKPSAQGAQSALSYGRRGGYAAALGIVTDEAEDDGESASNHSQTGRPAARPAPAPKAAPAAKSAPSGGATGGGKVFPFGRNKGRLITDFTLEELASAQDWCIKTDADKFADLIKSLSDEMMYQGGKSRPTAKAETAKAGVAAGFEEMPETNTDDELPF